MDTIKNSDFLLKTLEFKNKHILDLGCGDGSLCRFLAKQQAEVIGVDSEMSTIEKAESFPKVSTELFLHARAEDLPFEKEKFDIVLIFNSFHHFEFKFHPNIFREIFRILKTGGELLVLEPLAEGSFFDLVKIVDDETEVRFLAYKSIQLANQFGFQEHLERFFLNPIKYKDFKSFVDHLALVDPNRQKAIDKQKHNLEENFYKLAKHQDDIYYFEQPTRANLFTKNANA